MTKISVTDTSSGMNLAAINDNFQTIADALNNQVLYRQNPVGEANQMVSSNLDMNSNHILNLPEPVSTSEAARLKDVVNAIAGATQANLIEFTPYREITLDTVQGAMEQLIDQVDAITQQTVGADETSIANLRLRDKTQNTSINVLGYYAPGDGGGGRYYIDLTDTTSFDNGGTIIVGTDGGRWKRDKNQPLTIDNFGAKGDGLNDDAVPLANYFNSLQFTRGVLQLGQKSYVFSSFPSLTAVIDTVIQGVGNGVTAGANAGTVINIQQTGSGNFIEAFGSTGVIVRDIMFVCHSDFSGSLISFGTLNGGSNAAFPIVERCSFFGTSVSSVWTAINVDKTIEWTIRNCVFGSHNISIQMATAVLPNSFSGNFGLIEGCQFSNTRSIPIAGSGQAITVRNCTSEGWNNGGLGVALAGLLSTSVGNGFDGLLIEGCWTGDTQTSGGTTISVSGNSIRICNNFLGGNSGSDAISADSVVGLSIENNKLDTFAVAVSFGSDLVRDFYYQGNSYNSVANVFGSPSNCRGLDYSGTQQAFEKLPNGKIQIRGRVNISGGSTASVSWGAVTTVTAIETIQLSFADAPSSVGTLWPTGLSTTGFVLNATGSGSTLVYYTVVASIP